MFFRWNVVSKVDWTAAVDRTQALGGVVGVAAVDGVGDDDGGR